MKFDQFCNPIKNQTYECYEFHTCSQSEGENIDHYATELKNRAKTCKFGQLCDNFVRHRIVCCILSDNVRERLLRIPNLTHAKSIDICLASEVSKQQLKSITEDGKIVHAMRKDYKSGHKPKVKHQHKDSRKDNPKSQKYDCRKCGMKHLPRSCPAYRKTCTQCKNPNHFKKMCKSRRIHAIEEESDSGDEFYIGCIENQEKSENSWMVNLNLNGKYHKFKLDTGAQENVIPYKVLKLVKGDIKIIPSKTRLVTYSDTSINPVIHPPQRVPNPLQERFKSELERMEKLGFVEKVEHPTDWVSSTVKLRICLDSKDLNRAIKREHFILPRLEETTA
ncbi:unnamed protein product [Mytilus coruscus]|uniref:CCHC-type domain-containing protein n=1 Tax=Mytilus coruscus TaxID=42192 RepID=A0A6J8EIJ1_MYTCO|nr:unnamed protein product [Mytilus coruscus]